MIEAIKNVIKYKDFIIYSAKSELKAEVGNSHLNWAWWIIEPSCYAVIYAFVFGVIMQRPEPFFALFLFLGIKNFELFNKGIVYSVTLMKSSKSIISKVYLPKYVIILSKLLVCLCRSVFSWPVIAVMIIHFGLPINIYYLWLIPLLVFLCLVTFAFMCIIMHLGVFIEDLPNIMNIVLKLTMFLSGIFYSIPRLLPDWRGELWLSLNPVAFVINGFRDVIIEGRAPNLPVLGIWFVVSALIAWGGIKLIKRYENTYVKVI